MIIQLVVFKMIAIDLSKQKALNADLKAIQQINFTRNLNQQAKILFITIKRITPNFFIFLPKKLNNIY